MEMKPKEPQKDESFNVINGDSNSCSASDSSNTCKTLFGHISEQNNQSVSIFSDDNPFRRKPIDHSQLGLGFCSAEEENKNPKFIEVKKRKRRENLIDEALEIKRLKMDDYKPKSSDFGVQDEEINPNYSFDLKESSKREKGKVPKWGLESQEPLEIHKGKDPNMGFESDDVSNQENGSVSLESNGIEEKKKKKKRKRDEVEAAYQERRYGVMAVSGEDGEGRVVGVKRKKIDDPVDVVVLEEEGFDDDAKLLRTVFVGNLPLKVKKKVLFKEFSQFGEIESVRIQSTPLLDNKKPRMGAIIQKKINDAVDSVYAYIVFKTEESAQASLSHNMAVVGGNHISVNRACSPRKKLKGENAPLYDNKRTVFVGNLPFDVKDEEIYGLFSGIKNVESSIEAIQVIRDPGTSVGKGIAYVLFKTRGTANLVVKKCSLKLQDRELRIHHARPNLTPSKRKSPSSRQRNDSPTKKLATDLRIPCGSNKVNTKAANSYQGLRGSEQGVQKKVHAIIQPVKFKSGTLRGEKLKQLNRKRSMVAARKANALSGGDTSKQTGEKRKLVSQTPDGALQSKKIRLQQNAFNRDTST